MPYAKTTWLDRIVQYANRYTKAEIDINTLELTPAPGVITQAGTPLSAANLNAHEDAIELAVATAENAEALADAINADFGWVVPGNTLLVENLSEYYGSNRVNVLFKVKRPGKYRITGEAKHSASYGTGVVHISTPGSNHGIAPDFSTTSGTYVAFSLDMTEPVPPGGMIMISTALSADIRNLRVKYDEGNMVFDGSTWTDSY